MRRIPLIWLLLLVGPLRCGSALACGPGECAQTWKLVQHNFHGCQSDTAMLSPANDTRLNLMLFMADLHAARYKAAQATPSKGLESPLISFAVFNARFDAPKETKNSEGKDAKASGNDASQGDDNNSQGENDHCPKTFDRADGFPGAVQADPGLTPQEKDALLAARLAMRCEPEEKNVAASAKAAASEAFAKAVQAVTTASGKIFADYLAGAKLFREGDYKEAADAFTQLAGAQNPWIKETALYMLARTALKRAQEGSFDEYGNVKDGWKADPTLVAAGEAALDAYLAAYPKGLYAASAAGLKRRVTWIGAVTDKLAREYEALVAMDQADRNMSDSDLAQEIDNKLLSGIPGLSPNDRTLNWEPLGASPVLLAVLDLQRMRTRESGANDGDPGSPMTRPDLEAQKQAFAGNVPLYEYLLVAHAFYVENKPEEVLGLIPDAARQKSFTYLEFSRQMLRGLALEAAKDRNALGFWMQMLPGSDMPFQRPALELAVALHHERAGTVGKIFDADSPVRYPYLRQVLLLYVANAALLRQQATNVNVSQRERDKALFALLYKEATRGQPADFLKDVALVADNAPAAPVGGWCDCDDAVVIPDGAAHEYDEGLIDPGRKVDARPVPLGLFRRPIGGEYHCPSMIEAQKILVKNPNDPKALLCVADFAHQNAYAVSGLDIAPKAQDFAWTDTAPKADELGGSPTQFAGKPYARLKVYQSILANPKASADNKAYALYRAVTCFQNTNNSYVSNYCGGGQNVPKAQREAWFKRLKKDYPATRWAKKLQFYW